MSKVNKLQEEIKLLKNRNEYLEFKLKTIQNNVNNFREKMEVIEAIYQLSESQRPKIFGSFIRKIFELPFALNDFINNNEVEWRSEFGNFMTGDLDIFYGFQDDEKNYKHADELIDSLDNQLGASIISNEKELRPKLGNYLYVNSKIQNDYNLFGRSYKIYLKRDIDEKSSLDEKQYLTIDMMNSIKSTNFEDHGDFLINNMYMTNEGIVLFNKNNSFFRIISQIKYKVTDLAQYGRFSTNNYPYDEEDEQIKKLDQNIKFIKKRFFKLFQSGYSLKGVAVPIIETVTDESIICDITGAKAPFPRLKLKCKHWLSLMAYEGILFQGSSPIEHRHRCPFCRTKLELELEYNVIYPKLHNIKDFKLIAKRNKQNNYSQSDYRIRGVLSNEAYNMLFNSDRKEDEIDII